MIKVHAINKDLIEKNNFIFPSWVTLYGPWNLCKSGWYESIASFHHSKEYLNVIEQI